MGLFGGRQARGAVGLSPEMVDAFTARQMRSAGSPVPVGWKQSQAIPAALDAIRLRQELISTMPVQVFRRRNNGTPEEVDPPNVLVQPESGSDIIGWLAGGQKSLDMRGNGYGIIADRDRNGLPTQIELQHPDTVQCRYDRSGTRYYRVAGKRYEVRDIWHERSHDEPGSPVGLSPIAACARSLGINIASEQFGSDFFRDGAHPTALLSNEKADTIDQTTAQVVKSRFMAAVNGNREPVVLGGSWKFEQLSIAPNESQFLETLKFGVNQVARIFNVPAELIGGGADGSSLTYANRVDRALDFLTYRLGPSILRREANLSKLTPRGQYVKLNRSALLAADLLTRLRAYAIGLHTGVYALDEPRLLEDRAPLTDEQIQALKDAGLLGKPLTATSSTTETS